MPTSTGPDVDVLDRPDDVSSSDQRAGGGAKSPLDGGPRTTRHAMLRILFTGLGQPHVGPPNAFSFNHRPRPVSGRSPSSQGRRAEAAALEAFPSPRFGADSCPPVRGIGPRRVTEHRLQPAVIDASQAPSPRVRITDLPKLHGG